MNQGEVICTNGSFSSGYITWAKKNNVELPKESKIYTIRNIIKHSNSLIGVRLEEIINPLVDTDFGLQIEPSFSKNRFSTLLGDAIQQEEYIKDKVF